MRAALRSYARSVSPTSRLHRLEVALSAEMWAQLKAVAKSAGVSVDDVVGYAIMEAAKGAPVDPVGAATLSIKWADAA